MNWFAFTMTLVLIAAVVAAAYGWVKWGEYVLNNITDDGVWGLCLFAGPVIIPFVIFVAVMVGLNS